MNIKIKKTKMVGVGKQGERIDTEAFLPSSNHGTTARARESERERSQMYIVVSTTTMLVVVAVSVASVLAIITCLTKL